jgi:hypothetical protein
MNSVRSRLLAETLLLLAATGDRRIADFLGDADGPMKMRPLAPAPLPCVVHLDPVASVAAGDQGAVARLLADNRNAFHWGRTYTAADFGERFIENYGWMELFGTRGHFVNERMAGGFLVLGPRLHYPDHHHEAEEIYVPLTGGTLWRQAGGRYVERPAGAVIHHPSNVTHAMRTGEAPLLALYLWRGGPLAARSTISAAAPA